MTFEEQLKQKHWAQKGVDGTIITVNVEILEDYKQKVREAIDKQLTEYKKWQEGKRGEEWCIYQYKITVCQDLLKELGL